MDPRLTKIINKIKDRELRQKTSDFLNDPSVEIAGKTYTGLPFEKSPASRFRHHNYPCGLLEHIISSSKIALALCDIVEKIYEGKVNRDLVLSGVLLHDILKPITYNEKENGTYGNSLIGERIDHLTLTVAEIIRRGFSLDLIHIVAASHGEAGAISPKSVEALICHLADQADSQLNGEVLNAAKYLVRETIGEVWERMNSKIAFEIVNSKVHGGWNGLRETVERIRRNYINKFSGEEGQ